MFTSVSEWLGENVQWIFSGIGAAALLGAGKWVSARRRSWLSRATAVPEQVQEVDKGAEGSGQFLSGLTPARIMNEFKRAPMLQRQQVASHYIGLTLRVSGGLCNSWGSDQETILQLDDLPTVFLKVIPAEWPGLSLLREGARISAVGEIIDVSEFGLSVSPAKMEY